MRYARDGEDEGAAVRLSVGGAFVVFVAVEHLGNVKGSHVHCPRVAEAVM